MPRLERRSWPANPDVPGRRTDRRAFVYHAFVPDPISRLEVSLPGPVAQAISLAERQVDELNRSPPSLASLEVLARRLLRAESVASSRIEGLELSHRRLARAEAGGEIARDETALSVLGNVAAMERSVELGAAARPLGVADLLEIHCVLMAATHPSIAGRFRVVQNWLGGSSINPARAEFVPPPPEHVLGLVEDLVAFVRRDDLPPVAQAAIAHAQFETIHPFADGNGRVGRALVHVVLRRRGLAPSYVPPVSLLLAADARAYVAGLTAYRNAGLGEWLVLFAKAVELSARKAKELASRLAVIQDDWRRRAGRPRRDSAAEALIRELPARPIVTLATAAEMTGRSKQAANQALAVLERAGVLRELTLGKRNRAWEARELFDLIDDFERELATPEREGPGRSAPRPRRSTSPR